MLGECAGKEAVAVDEDRRSGKGKDGHRSPQKEGIMVKCEEEILYRKSKELSDYSARKRIVLLEEVDLIPGESGEERKLRAH